MSKSDRKKVEDGTYTIEQFKGKAKSGEKSGQEKRYDNIERALKFRDELAKTNQEFEDSIFHIHIKKEGIYAEHYKGVIDSSILPDEGYFYNDDYR